MATPHSIPDAIEIQLTQGQVAIVEAADSDVTNVKWRASFDPSYGNGGRYKVIRTDRTAKPRRTIYLHRVVMEHALGRSLTQGEQVDHVNGDTLDNRRSNLRVVTQAENQQNRGKRYSNKSGYKGVSWHEQRRKWAASIKVNKERLFLGLHDTPEAAYAAYCEAARKYHGEFARFE